MNQRQHMMSEGRRHMYANLRPWRSIEVVVIAMLAVVSCIATGGI